MESLYLKGAIGCIKLKKQWAKQRIPIGVHEVRPPSTVPAVFLPKGCKMSSLHDNHFLYNHGNKRLSRKHLLPRLWQTALCTSTNSPARHAAGVLQLSALLWLEAAMAWYPGAKNTVSIFRCKHTTLAKWVPTSALVCAANVVAWRQEIDPTAPWLELK